jgi:hypothetical protein
MTSTGKDHRRSLLLRGSVAASVAIALTMVACQFCSLGYFDGTHIIDLKNSEVFIHLWADPYTLQFGCPMGLHIRYHRPESLREALGLIRPFYDHGGSTEWFFIIPLWSALTITAAYPLYRVLRRRRAPSGHCQTCGYNLTGNVSGICPECGTPITPDKDAPVGIASPGEQNSRNPSG